MIARQVEQERLAMGFARAPSTTRASMVLAIVLAACVWPYRPGALVLGWLIIKLSVSSIRLYDLRLFEREQVPTLDIAAWERRFFRLVALEAALWGATGVLFMPAEAPSVRTLILGSLVGIAAIGVFNLAVRSRQALIYMALILLPCAALQLAQRDAAGVATAGAIGLYLFVLTREMKQSEGRLAEMLRLRFENAWIADERHQAMLLSEHASAAKSRFLAAVSHEMRTPLNGIMGMAQMLQRSPLADAQRRQLVIIGDSARHLQAVIGDLLDLSRIEFGKLKVDDAPLRLHDTVHEVTGLLQASAVDKGLHFTLTLAPELPERVMGDASRIKQVLHNLLGNAIKFTAHGEVALDVRVVGDELCFQVTDTGDGVPATLHERIFDAFEQGPAAAVPGRVGTG
ncbi:MAG TPA: histidine kinase dimerization/phospho-acceptor domain-containing protein, partial [Albitalea sp.]|nr:histidine kinase dimerization/phospho-acceptor domain-containing protein [Albitalea sp.]